MKFLVVLPLFIAASMAAPASPPYFPRSEPCEHGFLPGAMIPAPARISYPMLQPYPLIGRYEYDFPSMINAPAPIAVAPAPVAAAPAPARITVPVSVPAVVPVPVKPKIEYDFPAPIVAPAPAPVKIAAPAPIQVVAPAPAQIKQVAPVQIAVPAPAVAVVPHAVETRVHYAETPVVVGHTSQILKPNLGAAGVVSKTGEIVSKEKVLAPVRTVSDITPQVTVQQPTKVNVQKVAVDVPVAAPYAQPVPVPVAPQYEIHQVAPAEAPLIEMIRGVPCINGVPI